MSDYIFFAQCPECNRVTCWVAIDHGRYFVYTPSTDGYVYRCGECPYVTYDMPPEADSPNPVAKSFRESE